MAQYRVDSNKLELKPGSFFTTIPKFDYDETDLVLLDLSGLLIVGHYIRDYDGANWLQIPGYLICLTGALIASIVGLVVPLMA